MGEAQILLETSLGLGGTRPQLSTYIMKTKTKKHQEQVSRSEELNFFRKNGEEQKKQKCLHGFVSR